MGTENGRNQKPAKDIVQLTRNVAGHHYGETFTRDEATKLDIIKYCKPFTPGK